MKNYPSDYIEFLQTHRDLRQDLLLKITLSNGEVFRATTSQIDLRIGSDTWYAVKYGAWECPTVYAETNKIEPGTIDLKVTADATVVYPGTSTSLLSTILAGVFDKARVEIWESAAPSDDPWDRGITPALMFVGDITGADKLTATGAEFTASDLKYLLQEPYPRAVFSSSDQFRLFSVPNGLDRADFAQLRTTASGTAGLTIVVSSAFSVAHSLKGGYVEFTNGQNQGIRRTIADVSGTTTLILAEALPFPINVGTDQINLYPGYDGRLSTAEDLGCDGRYLGFPYIPNASKAV
jgi:hypothetical protein